MSDVPLDWNSRLAYVWQHAHDLAEKQYGDNVAKGYFTGPKGNAFLADLEALHPDGTVEQLMEVVAKHGIAEEPA